MLHYRGKQKNYAKMTMHEKALDGRSAVQPGSVQIDTRLDLEGSHSPYMFSSSPRALYTNRKFICGG